MARRLLPVLCRLQSVAEPKGKRVALNRSSVSGQSWLEAPHELTCTHETDRRATSMVTSMVTANLLTATGSSAMDFVAR